MAGRTVLGCGPRLNFPQELEDTSCKINAEIESESGNGLSLAEIRTVHSLETRSASGQKERLVEPTSLYGEGKTINDDDDEVTTTYASTQQMLDKGFNHDDSCNHVLASYIRCYTGCWSSQTVTFQVALTINSTTF